MEGAQGGASIGVQVDPGNVSRAGRVEGGRSVEVLARPTPAHTSGGGEASVSTQDADVSVTGGSGGSGGSGGWDEAEVWVEQERGGGGREDGAGEEQEEAKEEEAREEEAKEVEIEDGRVGGGRGDDEPARAHSRHGSLREQGHRHARAPSDVCPRVAVIATQEEEENVCSICLDEFCDDDPIAETQCGHGYHLQCIMQWAQRSRECPLCFSQLLLADADMNALLPFGEYSSPQEEQAMSSMIANMEFETFLVHLAAAERRQERRQRREQRHREQRVRRALGDGGHVVLTSGGSSDGGSAVASPSESMLKTVRRGFASFFLGK